MSNEVDGMNEPKLGWASLGLNPHDRVKLKNGQTGTVVLAVKEDNNTIGEVYVSLNSVESII